MTAYGIFFTVGLIVNAVKIQSPKFKALLQKTKDDFRRESPEASDLVSERAMNICGYGAATLGAVIGAATISLPVIVGKYLFDLYEENKDDDNDPTATAPV